MAGSEPNIWAAPPNPARAPAINITDVVTVELEIPAVRAAEALAPTALNLNPHASIQ
jgi:hypothetical protein